MVNGIEKNKKRFNFSIHKVLIIFVALIIVLIMTFVLGSSQISRYHYCFQKYIMPKYFPRWTWSRIYDDHTYSLWARWDYTGTWREWGKDGTLLSQIELSNGQENGFEIFWHDNHIKRSKLFYSKGQKQGKYIEWYKNGSVATIGNFLNNQAHGKFESWNENNIKKTEIEWVNGKAHGLLKHWYADGSLKSITVFYDDIEMSVKKWNKDGSEKELEVIGKSNNNELTDSFLINKGFIFTKENSIYIIEKISLLEVSEKLGFDLNKLEKLADYEDYAYPVVYSHYRDLRVVTFFNSFLVIESLEKDSEGRVITDSLKNQKSSCKVFIYLPVRSK